jgi:CDP-diacylglycerol--serine O-phosphatidyltransferase
MAFKKRIHRTDYKPKKGVYLLPNTLTLCSMFAGFYAILSAINGNFVDCAWAILIAIVFDGLDGWIARLTNTATRFGIELDSLSDVIAFGVAPAIMMYKWVLAPFDRLGWAAAFLFMACGALRLARFNVQTGTSTSKAFKGLPIPGAAAVLAALVIFYHDFYQTVPDKNLFFPVFTIILALFMVSTLRFHGFKEIDFKERKPFWALVIFVLILFFMLLHPTTAIFVFAMAYLALGIMENAYLLLKRKKLHPDTVDAAKTEKPTNEPRSE